MKRPNSKYLIRRVHRYLGVLIGVQFLFWTLGGIYFSWTNIEQIRGEDLRRAPAALNLPAGAVAPPVALEEVRKAYGAAAVTKIQLVEALGESFYEIAFHDANHRRATALAATSDGRLRPPFTEDEARRIAAAALAAPPPVAESLYLTAENVGGHHEYREKPLPAWAVVFENGPTVYVAAETGQVQAVRTAGWRVFDFLWMLHTLDFMGRDDINNYVLRGFSLLGAATILSGFLLFFVSSKTLRRRAARGGGRPAGN